MKVGVYVSIRRANRLPPITPIQNTRGRASRRLGWINNSKAAGHVENRRLCLIASNNAAVANKEEANGIVWGLSNRQ
jgi:hypothetical protein